MMRKLIISFGLATLLGTAGAAALPSDASAAWRGGHGGMHRAQMWHGPRFAHHRFHDRPAHFVHRRFHHGPFVRRHFIRHAFYGPRFVGAPVVAYGPECVVRRKVRWTPCGPVRIARRVCY